MVRINFERVHFSIFKALKQFYRNSAGNLTILCPLMNQDLILDRLSFDIPLIVMNQDLIPDSFSFDIPLLAPVIASAM